MNPSCPECYYTNEWCGCSESEHARFFGYDEESMKECEEEELRYELMEYFSDNVLEELIASAMSPKRLMKQISQYDDFEQFFANL